MVGWSELTLWRAVEDPEFRQPNAKQQQKFESIEWILFVYGVNCG